MLIFIRSYPSCPSRESNASPPADDHHHPVKANGDAGKGHNRNLEICENDSPVDFSSKAESNPGSNLGLAANNQTQKDKKLSVLGKKTFLLS